MNTTHSTQQTKVLLINAFIASLYVVLCFFGPASGALQFRLSESLNHLIVFNRKFFWGILLGVLLFNQFFGYGLTDTLFGGLQTFCALSFTILLQKKVHNTKYLLLLNTLGFTVSMFFIAFMLFLTAKAPFLPTYLTLMASEAFIMILSAPILYIMQQKIHFDKHF